MFFLELIWTAAMRCCTGERLQHACIELFFSPATRREQQWLQSREATVERRSVECAGLQAKWRPLSGVVNSKTCTALTAVVARHGQVCACASGTPSFFRQRLWSAQGCSSSALGGPRRAMSPVAHATTTMSPAMHGQQAQK
jgi:hypothetical protein